MEQYCYGILYALCEEFRWISKRLAIVVKSIQLDDISRIALLSICSLSVLWDGIFNSRGAGLSKILVGTILCGGYKMPSPLIGIWLMYCGLTIYKPRLEYFLPHFVKPFLCFQGVF